MTNIQKYLADPRPGVTLDELAVELNALAKLRDNARLAFCKRLAVAYLLIVGHVPSNHHPTKTDQAAIAKFYGWCSLKLRSATGKEYSRSTLRGYFWVGFSKDPEKHFRRLADRATVRSMDRSALGMAVRRAAREETPPKPVSITRLRTEHKLSGDVATEVNQLMRAWEQASSTARAQFIYMVTGKRLNAA